MAYAKSVLWLLGSGALGYTLLLLTAPNENLIAEKYPDARSPESLKKQKALLETLRLAAESKNPMYRQTKDEIESDMQLKKK